MKKTLIAVAALAAGAAFAQTSVTLYGIADAYVGVEKTTRPDATLPGALPLLPNGPLSATTAPYVSNSQSVVNSGGLSDSRIGLRVKEDLGNGYSAFTVFESGVNTDTGTGTIDAGETSSTRVAVVGFGMPFGKLSLGRQTTPMKDAADKFTDAQADSSFTAIRAAGNSLTGRPFAPRINNSIRFDLPEDSLIRGAIAVGTLNSADKTAGTSDRVVSASLGYVVPGKFGIGISHQVEKNVQQLLLPSAAPNPAPGSGSVVPGGSKATVTYVSSGFVTPVGIVNFGFGQGKIGGVTGKDKGWNLGLTIPVDAFTFIAQVSQFKADGQLGNLYNTSNKFAVSPGVALRRGTAKRTSLGLEGHYALSKRTTAYVGYNNTKNLGGIDDAKYQLFGVGVRHVF